MRVHPTRWGQRPGSHRIAAAGLLALGLTAGAPPLADAQQTGPRSVADLAERLIDSVVNISTSQSVAARPSLPRENLPKDSPFREFFDEFFNRDENDAPRRVQSLGSGFIVSEDGIIVTNNHVIEDADEVIVNFSDDTKLKAEILGRDTKTDLAVLKVDPPRPLPALEFAPSENLRVGDWVMAIGNPFGLGGTVTVGIVSARNRDIHSGPYDDYIQTDAAINRGNSGGPLFNMDGKVIGINTAIISPSGGSIGIGFAIPSEIAMNVIDQLREFGETRRGWLGVRIQSVTDDIAESLHMNASVGALIAGVTEDGPAEKAGIRPGDVIVRFDGKPVPAMRDLPRMVADTRIGKRVEVVVLRDGKEVTLEVELGRLEEAEQVAAAPAEKEATEGESPATKSVLGMTLSELTPKLREKYDIADSVTGVIVIELDPAGPAAEKRVQEGDVIVEVAQEPVGSPEAVGQRIEALRKDERKTALLLLSNGTGDLRFVALRIDG